MPVLRARQGAGGSRRRRGRLLAGARSSSTSTCSTTTSSARVRSTRIRSCSTTCRPGTGSVCSRVGDHRCALVYLAGPAAPNIMDGVSPELRRQGHAAPHQRVQPGRQRAHDQLDGGSLPHRRLGRARVPRARPGGRAAAPVGGDRLRLQARPRSTRSRPGRSGWTGSRRCADKLGGLRLDRAALSRAGDGPAGRLVRRRAAGSARG